MDVKQTDDPPFWKINVIDSGQKPKETEETKESKDICFSDTTLKYDWGEGVQDLIEMILKNQQMEPVVEFKYRITCLLVNMGRARKVIYPKHKHKWDLLGRNMAFIQWGVDKLYNDLVRSFEKEDPETTLKVLLDSDLFKILIPESEKSLKQSNRDNYEFFLNCVSLIALRKFNLSDYLQNQFMNWLTLGCLSVIAREDQTTMRKIMDLPETEMKVIQRAKRYLKYEVAVENSISSADIQTLMQLLDKKIEESSLTKRVAKVWFSCKELIECVDIAYQNDVEKIIKVTLKYLTPLATSPVTSPSDPTSPSFSYAMSPSQATSPSSPYSLEVVEE